MFVLLKLHLGQLSSRHAHRLNDQFLINQPRMLSFCFHLVCVLLILSAFAKPVLGVIITIDLEYQVMMCRCEHRTQECQRMIA